MRLKSERGFTLMELMVVIVIVAILAAVAVPLYINYVRDATRTEAKGAIGAIITAEQTYYQKYSTYVNEANFVKDPANNPGQTLSCDLTEALANWTFVVSGASTDGFVVTATNTDDATMVVTYTYSRNNPPTQPWTEQ